MLTPPPSRFSRARMPLATALLAVLALLFTPAAASAHDTIVSSSPAADATVPELPAELEITFSGSLLDEPGATLIEISGPDGAAVPAGEPRITGTTVAVPLSGGGAEGTYRVLWRVVGSDGHAISGEYSFHVGAVSAQDPDAGTPADGDDFAGIVSWILLAICLVAICWAIFAVIVRARRGTSSEG